MTLREKISRLPELPVETFEVAGKLGFSDKVPVITILPHKFPEPVKPPNPTPFATNKSTAWHRSYYVQVIYPRVFCQPPWDPLLINDAQAMNFFKEEDKDETCQAKWDVAAIAKKERFYKLSTLNGAKLQHPFWCSVKGGPWLAITKEDESCIDGLPNFWRLWIIEMPQVALSWYGHWEDIPSYPALTVIMGDLMMFDNYPTCCPGFKWCPTTMSCIPNSINCQDNIPF
jgi:hypothetical protein